MNDYTSNVASITRKLCTLTGRVQKHACQTEEKSVLLDLLFTRPLKIPIVNCDMNCGMTIASLAFLWQEGRLPKCLPDTASLEFINSTSSSIWDSVQQEFVFHWYVCCLGATVERLFIIISLNNYKIRILTFSRNIFSFLADLSAKKYEVMAHYAYSEPLESICRQDRMGHALDFPTWGRHILAHCHGIY